MRRMRRHEWRMWKANRRCWPFSPIPQPTAGEPRSSASIPMRRRYFSPAIARSRSSAPCAFPFSTIRRWSKRKPACEAELAVNAPYAPEIYRGVVAITREADGRLAIARQGRAGRMGGRDAPLRRDAHARSSCRRDRRGARRCARPCRRRGPRQGADGRGGAMDRGARQPTSTKISTAFRRAAGAIRARGRRCARSRQSRNTYARIKPLLAERGRLGRVRRGHGDLHLGNIVLIDERPVLFDAIEFDPTDRRGRRALRSRLSADGSLGTRAARRRRTSCSTAISSRRAASRTSTGLRRCHSFFRCGPRSAPRSPRRGWNARRHRSGRRSRARRSAYFEFARRAIAPPEPKFIAVGGLSGTGKSRLARALAPHVAPMPGARHRALGCRAQGAVRRRRDGKAAGGRLCADGAANASMPRSSTRRAASSPPVIRRSSTPCSRGRRSATPCAAAAKSADVRLHGLFLTADLATRLARVGDARGRCLRCRRERWRGRRSATTSARSTGRQIDASGTVEDTLARARAALDCERSTRQKTSPAQAPFRARFGF